MNAPDPTAPTPTPRSHTLRRTVFGLYALALLIATHWPQLTITGPVERTDLFIHTGAFGVWTMLLIACSFFGRALCARNVLISGALGLVYAPLDELSQSLPILNRVAAIDDALANILGVLLASAGALVLGRVLRARVRRR